MLVIGDFLEERQVSSSVLAGRRLMDVRSQATYYTDR